MTTPLPVLIQGGMGIAVSNWKLARAVSIAGQLGVVSGTATDAVLVRRLQQGDPEGDIRRALTAFPVDGVAESILDRYYVAGGIAGGNRYRSRPMFKAALTRRSQDLLVAANFVEVFLAKEGHRNPVGINLLEKVQLPTVASLYGAMLADVDYVLMGAGIPRAIPGILDDLAAGKAARHRFDLKGDAADAQPVVEFDPREYCGGEPPEVRRPAFLAIVSSHVLATMLARKIDSPVDGFVVEAPTAGGHNAPPRSKGALSESGEPVYGEKDEPNFDAIRELGLPFWLAGSRAEPEAIRHALDLGATGVQVGTAFAFCEESGFDADLKREVLDMSRRGEAKVFTDPIASPTGFPFKVIQMPGTLSDQGVYDSRERVCDLGYLRTAYTRDDGSIGWRCPAEPVDQYVAKGGDAADTVGRKCLCNALMANIGLGQKQRNGEAEGLLVTSGDDVENVARFLRPGADSYTAADAIDYLLAGVAH